MASPPPPVTTRALVKSYNLAEHYNDIPKIDMFRRKLSDMFDRAYSDNFTNCPATLKRINQDEAKLALPFGFHTSVSFHVAVKVAYAFATLRYISFPLFTFALDFTSKKIIPWMAEKAIPSTVVLPILLAIMGISCLVFGRSFSAMMRLFAKTTANMKTALLAHPIFKTIRMIEATEKQNRSVEKAKLEFKLETDQLFSKFETLIQADSEQAVQETDGELKKFYGHRAFLKSEQKRLGVIAVDAVIKSLRGLINGNDSLLRKFKINSGLGDNPYLQLAYTILMRVL